MNTDTFEGRAGMMRKSPWLAAEDLDGLGEVRLTIAAVYKHTEVEFEEGRKEPVVFSLKFEKGERQLIVNATNRRRLVALFGTNAADWKGKQVALYVDEKVRKPGRGGGFTKGIRIK